MFHFFFYLHWPPIGISIRTHTCITHETFQCCCLCKMLYGRNACTRYHDSTKRHRFAQHFETAP